MIDFSGAQNINLIYYDAFAPDAQPELWTEGIFQKLYRMLLPNGVLTAYCSKGNVQRAMKAAGFEVEKLSGPPGKREMIRAGRSFRSEKYNSHPRPSHLSIIYPTAAIVALSCRK